MLQITYIVSITYIASILCNQVKSIESKVDDNLIKNKKEVDREKTPTENLFFSQGQKYKNRHWYKEPVCKPIKQHKEDNSSSQDDKKYKPVCKVRWEPECKPVEKPKKPEYKLVCEPKFEPVCKPVEKPKKPEYKLVCEPKFEPVCKPVEKPKKPEYELVCEPKWEPVCRPELKQKHNKKKEQSKPVYESSSSSDLKYKTYVNDDSEHNKSKTKHRYAVDCRETVKPVCRPIYKKEKDSFRIMSNDLIFRGKGAQSYKPRREPSFRPRFGGDIGHRWELKYRPRWEQELKPICVPKVHLECEPQHKRKHERKEKHHRLVYKPVCEPEYSNSSESDNKHSESSEKYEVVCEQSEETFKIMGGDYNRYRRNEPPCKPKCEEITRYRRDDDCIPICDPLCKPHCDPIIRRRHHHRKHKPKKIYVRDVSQYVRQIRQVLIQGAAEVSKLARFFAEDIKTKLVEGLQLIIKGTGNKAIGDLHKLEQRIIDIVTAINKNILRDTDALITNTNEEILDNLTILVRTTNSSILSDIAALVAAILDPLLAIIQPLDSLLAILANRFGDLLINVPTAFKKLSQAERTAIEKIVNDNKHEVIKEVSKLLEEFDQRIARLLSGLTDEEVGLINNVIDQSSRKLLVDLEHILQQIGEAIIIILKGKNCNFQPLMFGTDTEWNVAGDNMM